MVLLDQVKSSNSRVASTLPANLVAVFAGATAGIGELSLKSFVKYAIQPRVYFIGRSKEAGERLKKELKALNDGGEYIFIEADMSLLKNVDKVCAQIKERERAVNILFMSQGTLRMGSDTSEGLPYITALTYYSRIRLAVNLLPLLREASSLRRVVSVFAGGREDTFYPDDIPARKVSMSAGRGHLATVMTLCLEALAQQAPDVSFIHNFPGAINTNLIRKEDGMLLRILNLYFKFTMRNKWMDNEECGERHAFLCTSGMYPSSGETANGVTVEEGLQAAKGSNGKKGSGVYTIDDNGECANEKVLSLLERYRSEGMVDRVWSHTEGEFWRIMEAGR